MQKGTIVISLAGHDKGRLYVVLETESCYAMLCDGKRHTIEKPKKKKHKHLKITEYTADLSVYSPLYDAHIVKELKSVLNKGGCCLG